MTKPLLAAVALLTVVSALSGCSRLGQSSASSNPFGSFSGSRSEARAAQTVRTVQVVDRRPLVSQVTRLDVERTPGGAIVTAVGLPPSQGYWDARLVPVSATGEPENGAMVYDFRVQKPLEFQIEGTPRSREVTVAVFLSNIDLAQINRIVVRGQLNQRSTGR